MDMEYQGRFNASVRGPQENVCINGKLAPSFFLLGAQKSATTNFFSRLMDVALDVVPAQDESDPNFFWKEPHVFDSSDRYYGLGRDGWLSYYPDCSTKVHAIALDASPSYISSPEAPVRMMAWYGAPLAQRLQFLVMIREPLSRMHSSFYHGKQWAFAGLSFQQYIAQALGNAKYGCPSGKVYNNSAAATSCLDPDDMPLGDPFYLSLYVPQLKRWFQTFSAKQFVIAPMLTYVAQKQGQPSLVEHVAVERLGSAIKLGSNTKALEKDADGAGRIVSYPSLEDDLQKLPEETWQGLVEVMSKNASPESLSLVLAPKMLEGLTLWGYNGATTISQFISANW
jgi:hypothetical protein